MNIEYQFIGMKVLVKLFYLITMIFFAIELKKKSEKMFLFSVITAICVFIKILISIPLPIQYENIGISYMATHILAILVINYLKLLLVFYMPFEKEFFVKKLFKENNIKYSLIVIFILLISGVLLVNSFGNFLHEDEIFLTFVSIDAITTTIVMILYSFLFYKSFVYVNQIKSFNKLLAITLIASNVFYFIFFLKTLEILNIENSVWFRIISFLFGIIAMAFDIFYLVSYLNNSSINITENTNAEENWSEIIKIQAIHICILSSKQVLSLTLVNKEGLKEKLTLEIDKATKPFAYWVHFAIAKKLNIDLTHIDISIIKFRMVEFWNKSMKYKIRQDLLFSNSRIQYNLIIDADKIEIKFDDTIMQKQSIYQQIFIEFYSNYLPVLKSLEIKTTHKKDSNSISKSFYEILKKLN